MIYNNLYSVTFRYPQRIPEDFSTTEKEEVERAVEAHNDYFANATAYQTQNRKHISSVEFCKDRLIVYFETEKRLPNYNRRGNALRQFSRFLSEEGFDLYLHNKRLARSV